MAKIRDEIGTTHGVRAADAGLAIERRFTRPGVHPFDEHRVGDAPRVDRRSGEAGFRAARRRVPEELVAERDQHRLAEVLPRPDGLARSARAPSSRWSAAWPARSPAGAARAATSRARTTPTRSRPSSPTSSSTSWRPSTHRSGSTSASRRSRSARACFILSVDDTMESILDWNTKEGMIFRGGSGSGINLSKIRSSKEQLSKGGLASGPVSFMRGADAWAGTIKSGGKTRRAAKMVVLDVDHPDIRDFIWCKAREEDKAAALRRRRLRHVDRRRGLPLDPVPEREQLGARDRGVPRRRRAAATSGRRSRA